MYNHKTSIITIELNGFFCCCRAARACRGSLAQNLYISGMKLTSATFATAMTNLIPAITFILAVIFRYESLAFRTFSGQAKVAGTFLGVGGAMLLTFYKGADITPWTSHVNLTAARHHHASSSSAATTSSSTTDRVMVGSVLITGSCFFYALWLILQARLSREYPFHYSSTALMCVMSTVQSVAFALCHDRDVAQWRLGLFDVRLLSVVYSGVLASGVMLVVLSWCVKRRGPLFASVFNPLMLLVVAVISSLLGERLHLGSALGAVLIVMGLYAVLWGKRRETATEAAKVVGTDHDDDGQLQVVVQQNNIHHQSSEVGDKQMRSSPTTRC
jgi:drug/metabolite transporter (DMT)-like permease